MNGNEGFLERARRLLFPTRAELAKERGDTHTYYSEMGKKGVAVREERKRKRELAEYEAWARPSAHEAIDKARWVAWRRKEQEREAWEEQRYVSKHEAELEKWKVAVGLIEKKPEIVSEVLDRLLPSRKKEPPASGSQVLQNTSEPFQR